ncbi:MAG: hypothetical protein DYH07_01455 [Armatimonadetes bacterium ATM1]|nr:MAG: hypothetical protein EDM73_03590 [Armatimonadota bacterium]MCE7898740.1 hypothetical protein [Armatimonadetes bacterium ATM1]RIJ98458.1 MAG: hypothetical protein DCC45_01455 [Armatimonadota bacterium]
MTQAAILRIYYPLAASWLLMAIEAPVAVAIISRLPEATIATAGFLILGSLALWIESPVIDLLATSTTLSTSRERFCRIRKFTLLLIAIVTAAHAICAFGPVYRWITLGVLGVSREISDAVHPGMVIMIPWSGCIGWRRFLQGVLIRNGYTKAVGVGTAVRATTMIAVGVLLYQFTQMPSIQVVAWALVSSVATEAAFVHFAAHKLAIPSLPKISSAPLGFRDLSKFHLPLSATTMITLTSPPIIAGFLARTADSVAGMAAWQVATTVLFLHRTVVFALPEVVIYLQKDEHTRGELRRFCLTVGAVASLTALLVSVSGLGEWIFRELLGAEAGIASLAVIGLAVGALTPLIGAMQSFARGMLTARHITMARLGGIVVGMVALIATLGGGVAAHMKNVALAPFALTVALAAEYAFLAWSLVRSDATYVMPTAEESASP